jgi:hypothetical protein
MRSGNEVEKIKLRKIKEISRYQVEYRYIDTVICGHGFVEPAPLF